jgi:uncharacterized protein (TIGR03000 family)
MRYIFWTLILLAVAAAPAGAAEENFAPPRPRPTRAALDVRLPADARLTVDGATTRSTSHARRLVSPPLDHGRTYHYVLEAEVSRGGKAVRVSRTVPVQAGATTAVDLSLPADEGRPAGAAPADAGDVGERTSGPGAPVYAPAYAPAPAPWLYRVPAAYPYAPASGYSPAPRLYNPDDHPRRGGPPGSNHPLSLGVGHG